MKRNISNSGNQNLIDPVKFYKPNAQYGYLSNYYMSKIDIETVEGIGIEWPSNEHYFQASKFIWDGAPKENIEYAEIIRKSKEPYEAFLLGRQKPLTFNARSRPQIAAFVKQYKGIAKISEDWDSRKDAVMKKVVEKKFKQNGVIREQLIATKPARIIENSPRDDYWGIGKNGNGANKLGEILEQVRDAFNMPNKKRKTEAKKQ